MTRNEIINKYNITNSAIDYYIKKFNHKNWKVISIEIEDRINIEEYVKELLLDKNANDIKHLFSSYNLAYNFINKLFASRSRVLIQDRTMNKYMMIIAEFGEKYEKMD